MEKIIHIILDSEKDAFEILQKIALMNHAGDTAFVQTCILSKDADGHTSICKACDTVPSDNSAYFIQQSLGDFDNMVNQVCKTSDTTSISADINCRYKSFVHLENIIETIPSNKFVLIGHIIERQKSPLDKIIEAYNAEMYQFGFASEIKTNVNEEFLALNEQIRQTAIYLEETSGETKRAIEKKLQELKAKQESLF